MWLLLVKFDLISHMQKKKKKNSSKRLGKWGRGWGEKQAPQKTLGYVVVSFQPESSQIHFY